MHLQLVLKKHYVGLVEILNGGKMSWKCDKLSTTLKCLSTAKSSKWQLKWDWIQEVVADMLLYVKGFYDGLNLNIRVRWCIKNGIRNIN